MCMDSTRHLPRPIPTATYYLIHLNLLSFLQSIRGHTWTGPVKIAKDALLPIDASSSSLSQPCQVFGVDPNMPFLKKLYEDKDASFIAGIGVLSKPTNKKNYYRDTVTRLFAHNAMTDEIGRLDPHDIHESTGVMGRLNDAIIMEGVGYSVNSFAVDENLQILEGTFGNSTKKSIDSKRGFVKFNPSDDQDVIGKQAEYLNGISESGNSFFSDTWSDELYQARNSDNLYWAQESVDITAEFSSRKFEAISKMVGSSECRGRDRDLFHVKITGFDHHRQVGPRLEEWFDFVNNARKAFVEEMKVSVSLLLHTPARCIR